MGDTAKLHQVIALPHITVMLNYSRQTMRLKDNNAHLSLINPTNE